jgi:hypothetical protein
MSRATATPKPLPQDERQWLSSYFDAQREIAEALLEISSGVAAEASNTDPDDVRDFLAEADAEVRREA